MGCLHVAKYLPHLEGALILVLRVDKAIVVILGLLNQRVVNVEKVGVHTTPIQFLKRIIRLMWSLSLV